VRFTIVNEEEQQRMIRSIIIVILIFGVIWSLSDDLFAHLMNGKSLVSATIIALVLFGVWKRRKRRG
jgi:Sec-independent protein secretion pathway component TatC